MAPSADLDARPRLLAYGLPMSIEEWERMAEDEPGEIADGRLEAEEEADSPHEVIVSALLFVLLTWARARGGRVLASETKYALSKRRGRKPDISMFLTRDQKLALRGAMRPPPDLVVEVISRIRATAAVIASRSCVNMPAFGVRYYWLVDPEARSLEILRLDDAGHYVHAADAGEGQIDAPGFEGLTLDLDALWRELDEEIEPRSEEG
jgi:Uma2 family endonuclease